MANLEKKNERLQKIAELIAKINNYYPWNDREILKKITRLIFGEEEKTK